MELKGKSALVVGLGKSGIAAAKLLVREGARVAAVDAKPAESLRAALDKVGKDVKFLGAPAAAAFAGRDLIVKSPGVPQAVLEGAPRGAEIIGEAELAFGFLKESVIGITGTNGKSTTTALTAHLLQTAGLKVFAGGNLGTALSERVLAGGELDVTVCELSSFQLEDLRTFHCKAAAVLNITPDHIDRYASMEQYTAAKARIFERQKAGDLAVLNGGDTLCRKLKTLPGVKRAQFDETMRVPGGVVVERAEYQLRANTLRGAHNAENALAALLLARHFGAAHAALQRGLDTYPGLPHRLEPIRTLAGVEYINDSKATNVDSVEKSLSAFERGVHIIMGGRGKGAPYAPLRALFKEKVKAIYTVGEDAARIEAELGDVAPVVGAGDIATALQRAHAAAKAGEVVLLSPACASYDQFKNFEERGERFKALVGSLT